MDESDLIAPVDRLVRGVQAEGAELFQLFAYSPAHRLYRILEGGTSNVDKFVMTSEIQWGHGRGPGKPRHPYPSPPIRLGEGSGAEDPTHQVLFFNNTDEPGP